MFFLNTICHRLFHPYNRSELKANLAVAGLLLLYGGITLTSHLPAPLSPPAISSSLTSISIAQIDL